ncbi:MAG TPA: ATP-binding cassette domain-containing protein [Acidimicrobiales bacterium]|nr:ATP-binding cassette domain-containing protein [Acidimicrobiales bacterium]
MSFSVATGVSAASSGNGVGKTTAMRAVMGILRTGPGEVCWHGRTVDDEVRRRFGYMPEERGLYKAMRVREHLVFLARLHGQRRNEAERSADRWIEALGLAERRQSVVEDLSFGNQQRRSSLPHWPTPSSSSCSTNLLGSRPHRCRRHERRAAGAGRGRDGGGVLQPPARPRRAPAPRGGRRAPGPGGALGVWSTSSSAEVVGA